MAKTKEQKVAIVEKLEHAFKSAASAVLVGFSGVSVSDETAMRRALREKGITYTVAKKTLVRRALGNLGHAAEGVQLDGELAVAHGGSDDITAPARLIHEFGAKFAGKLAILGGLFDGRLVGKAEMVEIATIPAVPILRGMFVNVINSPIQGLVLALNAIAEKKSQA